MPAKTFICTSVAESFSGRSCTTTELLGGDGCSMQPSESNSPSAKSITDFMMGGNFPAEEESVVREIVTHSISRSVFSFTFSFVSVGIIPCRA